MTLLPGGDDPTVDRLLSGTPIRPIYLVEIQPKGEGLPQKRSIAFRYECEERSGHLIDSSGNGLDSTAESGITYRHAGRISDASAVEFDGAAGSKVTLPAVALDDDGGSLAVGAWIYDVGARQVIWGLFESAHVTDPDRITLEVRSTGTLRLLLGNGTTTGSADSTSPITFAAWHDIRVTWHKSGSDTLVNFWCDGVQIGTDVTITGFLLTQPTTALDHFLGTDLDVGPTYNDALYAVVDYVIGWSVRLTSDEVAQLDRWRVYSRFRALSGDTTIDGYPLSIARVDPISSVFSLEDNRLEISSIDVEVVRDGWLDYLEENYRLKGAAVLIWQGDQRARGVSEYERVFTGAITEITEIDGGGKLIQCAPLTIDQLFSAQTAGPYIGHPLEVATQLFDEAITAGAEVSYDAASFDPEAYEEISHFHVQRYGKDEENGAGFIAAAPFLKMLAFGREVDSETTFAALIGELFAPMPGKLLLDAESKLSYAHYDADGAVDEDWTEADILSIEPISNLENLVNTLRWRIEIIGGEGAIGWVRPDHREYMARTGGSPIDEDTFARSRGHVGRPYGSYEFDLRDEDSIATYGVASKDAPQSGWLGGAHLVTSAPGDGDPISPIFISPSFCGVCGFSLKEADRARANWGNQEAWRQVDSGAGRSLWCFDGVGYFRVDTVAYDYAVAGFQRDPYGAEWPVNVGTAAFYYTDIAHDLFGTTDLQSDYGSNDARAILDVTIAKTFSDYYLSRVSHGLRKIRVRAHPRLRGRALATKLSLEWSRLKQVFFGGPSEITPAIVWEIVGSVNRLDEDPPHIEYTLAFVRNDTATPVDLGAGYVSSPFRKLETEGSSITRYYASPVPGFSISLFDLTIDEGGVLRRGEDRWILPPTVITFQADKSFEVWFDTAAGTYNVVEVDPGGDLGDHPYWHALIFQGSTDGTHILTLIPITQYDGLVGESIGGLVPSGSISDASIDDDKTVRTKRGTVQTTNNTPTTILSIAVTDETCLYLNALIAARKTDGSAHAAIQQDGCVHRTGGGGVVVDNNTQAENLTGSGWTAAWVASGNNIELQVTGAAATTINWAARARWEEAS